MNTNKITIGEIQLNFASYQEKLNEQVANKKKWNTETAQLVEKILLGFIQESGLPFEVTSDTFNGDVIIDLYHGDRLLEFVPAKNGTVAVKVTESHEEDEIPKSSHTFYHLPEEFENPYFVRNYINQMIHVMQEWDSQP